MKPWRVVLDTSMIVAALRSAQGASYQVLMRLGGETYEACLTVPLVMEYESAAMRLPGKTPLTAEDIGDILDYICTESRHLKVHFLWRPFLRDPDDDMVLEAAVSAQARYIVTHNIRDFVGAEQFGIRTIRPGAFLARMRRRS